MALTGRVKDGDWRQVRQNFQKITRFLGKDKTPIFSSITLSGLTASRLIYTDSSGELTSTDLDAWVTGTPNRVTVADDGDGTITLSGPQDLSTSDHPTFDYINLSTSQGITGLTTTDHPTFDYINLSTSQGVTGLTVSDHPHFDYIVLDTSQGITGLGTGDAPTFTNINVSISQGITGLTTSDSPTFNNLTLTGTYNGRQTNPDNDNTYDLGESGRRWKDLYLAGVLYGGSIRIVDGGTIGSASDTDVMTIDASGNTTFSVFPITPSAAPDADYEVANKKYVDDEVAGAGGGGDTYTDRGDPGGTDFASANFTKDEAWHDLDLSSIVPDGATAVEVWVGLVASTANSSFFLRENGNSNAINVLPQECRTTGTNYYMVGKVSCDSSRVIEYWASNVTWPFINFVVRGWYI